MESELIDSPSPTPEPDASSGLQIQRPAPDQDGRGEQSTDGGAGITTVLDRPLAQAMALDWEKVLYIGLILAAFATRFYDLGTRVMSHDESLHTYYSWRLYQGNGFEHTPLMHGPLQFHLLALTYFIFGDSDFTARIPAVLFSIAGVAVIWFFRRYLGRTGALVAATLMLISPYMLYYGRYTRNESYVAFFGLLTVWAVFRYMETREAKWLYLLAAATALHYTSKETSFIYHAIFMLFLGLHLVREIFAVRWPNEQFRRPFRLLFWLAVAAVIAALGLFILSRGGEPLGGAGTVEPVVPGQTETLPAAPASPLVGFASGAGIFAVALSLAGAFLLVRGFGLEIVRRFPALDLLIIFGTFVLPQLTALPVRALGWNPLDYSSSGLLRTAVVLVPLALLSAAVGLAWDWRKWLIAAGIFYSIFTIFYTTVFTNGGGFFSGMVGSLGYWLDQQSVNRGSQPWYYYILVQVPVYEFLPAVGALLAAYYGLRKWWSAPKLEARDHPVSPADLLDFPFIGFIGFWAALSVVAYSIAGEKMPWLTVHISLPFILLSGWSLGRLINAINWHDFRLRRGWVIAGLLPLLIVAVGSAFRYLLFGPLPFQGKELPQLQATSSFLSALVMSGLAATALYYAARGWNWRPVLRLAGLTFFGLLGVLTARAAFISSYVNYDNATEFLVYAHSATSVKTVMSQVEEISRRTTDGMGVQVAYDDDVSWPMTWYMRDFYKQKFYGSAPTREALDVPLVIAGDDKWGRVEPLLGERYYQFEYIRMWWPMQDYFDLNWERIQPVFTDAKTREGLWQIWLNRNYKPWGELTNRNFELSQWPVVDRMRFYIRKDLAAQIWNYGVGPTALVEPLPEDPYKDGRVDLSAQAIFGAGQGGASGQFESPHAVAVGDDGSVYVADTLNHRIQKLDSNGNALLVWGAPGRVDEGGGAPGEFNEPWGIAVAPDGSVYVADTWNHRIQKFTADGQFLTMWGTNGLAESPTSFFGPRGLAVDRQGRVYVADTGNKRVVVFDPDGNFVAQIGGPGYEDGLFDEPVGVAVSPDGRVYVADTWNLRVQWFEEAIPGDFTYAGQWPISGWYGQSLDNKPYITVADDGRVFVSDPEGYRILEFSADGEFQSTWGDFGSAANQFGLPAGLATDPSGRLYVVDSSNHRVMVFTRGE